ncbi:serine-rich adhesin for platelets-like isoform X2 [Palaemon carinicauda]|uniref:serine-rich adhesin for platelets-like isoform X2 n=1 Tax=Palaemon carinicauda TaxID=392227 RepID=UPI0035B5A7A5
MNSVLNDVMKNYNTWAKQDAAGQGFTGWDMERGFTTFRHEQDGVTLVPACQEARRKALRDFIEHTQSLSVPRAQEFSINSKEVKFIPTAITLVFDETEYFLSRIKYRNLFHLSTKYAYIRYQDVHLKLGSQRNAGERMLYIVFGGIDSILNFREDLDCKASNCISPLKRIDPFLDGDQALSNALISCALSLRKEIENANESKVIFSTLLPIDLKAYDEHAIREHFHKCKHQAKYRPKALLERDSRTLALAVKTFNTWARLDAHIQGFYDWNVEELISGITVGSEVIYLPDFKFDGRSINWKWQTIKTEVVTTSVKKTFEFIDQINEKNKVETSKSQPPAQMSNSAKSQSPAQMSNSAKSQSPAQMSNSAKSQSPAQMSNSAKSQPPAQMSNSAKSQSPAQMSNSAKSQSPAQMSNSAKSQPPAQMSNSAKSQPPAQMSNSAKSQSPAQMSNSAKSQSPAQMSNSAKSQPPAQMSNSAKSQSPARMHNNANSQSPAQRPNSTKSQPPTQMPNNPKSQQPAQMPNKANSQSPARMPNKANSQSPARMPNKANSQSPARMPNKANSQSPARMPNKANSQSPARMPNKANSQSPAQRPNSMKSQSPARMPNKVNSQSPAQRPSSAKSQPPAQMPNSANSQSPAQMPNSAKSQPPARMPNKANSQSPAQRPNCAKSQPPAQMPNSANSQSPARMPNSAISQPSAQMPNSTNSQSPTQMPNSAKSQPSAQMPNSTSSQSPTQMPNFLKSQPPTQRPNSANSQLPVQMPNSGPSCSKAENRKFDHVVILGNTLYWHILQDFKSPRITTIGAEQLSFCQIPKLIRQHRNKDNSKALWLLPIGIYSLTEFHLHPSCKNCPCPLHVVTLERNIMPSMEDMVKYTKDLLQQAKALCQIVQEILDPEAVVLFIPPIRAVVVVEEMFKPHELLHQVCEMHNAFCGGAETLNTLREYYNQFCELWKTLVPENLNSTLPSLSVITKYQAESQGQNLVPIVDGEDYTYAVELWKDMVREFIAESLGAFQINRGSISTISDKDQNHRGSSTGLSDMHILCIGSKNLCDNFASLQKQIPITFAHENVDFSDECCKKFISYMEKVPQPTAWVILVDMSLLTQKNVQDTHCSRAHCRSPIEYHVLKEQVKGTVRQQEILLESMIDQVLAKAKFFAVKLVARLPRGSVICFLPVATTCATIISPRISHGQIHELKRAMPDVQVLQGQYDCWYKCTTYFDKIWKQFLLENTRGFKIHELLLNYYKKKLEFIALELKLDSLRVKSRNAAQWSSTIEEILLSISKDDCVLRRESESQVDSAIFITIDDSPHSPLGLTAQDPAISNLTGAPSQVAVSRTAATTPQDRVQVERATPVPHSASNISVTSSLEKENRPTKETTSNRPSPNVLAPNTPGIVSCMERNTKSSPLNASTSVNSALLDRTTAVKDINHPKNSSNTNSLTKANPIPHSTSNVSVTTSSEKANRPTKGKPSDTSSPKVLSPNTPVTESCVKREVDSHPLNASTSVNSVVSDKTTAAKSINHPKNSSNTNSLTKANPVSHSTSNVSVTSSSEKENRPTKRNSSETSSPKVLSSNTPVIESCVKRETESIPLNTCTSVNSVLPDKTTTAKSINYPKNSSNTKSLSGGIVSAVPATALSHTSLPCSLNTTLSKVAVPSAVPDKAQVSESSTKAQRKSTELPVKQLEPPKKILNKEENASSVGDNVESTLTTSVTTFSKSVSNEKSSITEKFPAKAPAHSVRNSQPMKATDKVESTNLSSSNQNALDRTVVSASPEASQSDSFNKINQRKAFVDPTCQEKVQDRESLNGSSKAVVMKNLPLSAAQVSKGSSEQTEPSSKKTDNKNSPVSAIGSPASMADTSLKVPSPISKQSADYQPSSTNLSPLSRRSSFAVIPLEKGYPSNVAPKPAPSSVTTMTPTKSGSSSNFNTNAKTGAPTCIVHPTTVHATDLSTHEATRSEGHSISQSNSVSTSGPTGSARYTLNATNTSNISSVPLDVSCASTAVYTCSPPLKTVSHNQRIPTAVVTPKINMQKNCSTPKSSQTKSDIRVDRGGSSDQTTYGIILLNLNKRIKNEDLKLLFEACGPVHSMLRPSNIIGKPTDYGWAKFLRQDDAVRAKKVFSAVKLEGNPLRVKTMGVYVENSDENVLEADRALYKKLVQVAMKCKLNLSLKDDMAIHYADPQKESARDQLPVSSKEKLMGNQKVPSQGNQLGDKKDCSQGNQLGDKKDCSQGNQLGDKKDCSQRSHVGLRDKDDDEISLSSVSLSSLEDLCTESDKYSPENSRKTNLKVSGKTKADGTVENNQQIKVTSDNSLIHKPSTSSTPKEVDKGVCSWRQDVCKRFKEKGMLGIVSPCITSSTQESSSSLSIKDTVMDETLVKVSNLSDVVPGEIVDRLFSACGALEKGKSEGNSGAKVFRFPTFRSALLAEGQMMGLRLLDKKLNVKVMRNKSGDKPVLNLDEEMKVRNNILLVLADYENLMVNVAKAIAESGVNVYGFKTQLCTKQSCSSPELCHDYHSAEDKRRNPLLYNYSTVMCCMVQNKKECNRQEECEDAHSIIEILFHNTRFRKNICIGWSHLLACPMVDKVCPFTHPDTPDFFFHPRWQNLYVEGLHNTLLFLSGAILNYFRLLLPDFQSEFDPSAYPSILHVRILVITPTADMVKLYEQAVKELALTCNLKVAAVTFDTVTQDASILIGTPASLSKLLVNEKKKTTKVTKMVSNIKAIIVDDIQSVLKEFSQVSSHQALKELLRSRDINKVAVAEDIQVIEVHKTSGIFNSKLNELPVKKQPQSCTTRVCKEAYESASQKIPNRTFSPVEVQPCEKTIFTSPQNQPLTKSNSDTTPADDQNHSFGILDKIPPLSPVSDTETVLYTCDRSPSLPLSSWSPSAESPSLSDFPSGKSSDMTPERSPANRKRKPYSSRNEGSSGSRAKRRRPDYFPRQFSPSPSPSSKDYSSYSTSPNHYENCEGSSSKRHDFKSSSRKRKLSQRSREDEEDSPASDYSTRRPSSSKSRSHRSRSPGREKSSRRSSRSPDRVSSRQQSRSSKRSPKRREKSSRHRSRSKDRSHRYRSESSKQSPKRHHSHHSRHKHKHHSKSKKPKSGHKCKKHSSKQYISSSEKQRATPLSSILLEDVPGDLEGKERERRSDDVADSSHHMEKASSPLEKQNTSKKAEETIHSKAVPNAAINITQQQEESPLLDEVPSWDEVIKHNKEMNSVILKSKEDPSSKPKRPPEDVSTPSVVSPCEICRVKFDPETDEEYLKVENTLKQMHSADYQVFLDSPEVHPDYEASYEMFEQYYRQRYGNQGTKELHETVWNLFWEEIIHDKEKEEWIVKREGLLKQFEINGKQNCKCASKESVEVLELMSESDTSSDVIIIEDETSSSSKCVPSGSSASCITNQSSSSNSKDKIGSRQAPTSDNDKVDNSVVLSVPFDKDLDFSLTESLHILGEVCETLVGEFFGSLMKKVIRRLREFSNTKEAFQYIGEEDTIKLLEMAAVKVKDASVTAEGSDKSKLIYCSHVLRKLIDHASSTSSHAKINIGQIAKATMNQEISVVLGVIREKLKECGIKDPSLETVRQVYSEVSSLNLKAALGHV